MLREQIAAQQAAAAALRVRLGSPPQRGAGPEGLRGTPTSRRHIAARHGSALLVRRGTGSRGYAPLDNPALPFSARKRKRKSMRPDSLWTNPLDCPFGKWGARYASAGCLVARFLFGILSARAPDPFPKRAGDLSALRMAAARRGLAPFFLRAAGVAALRAKPWHPSAEGMSRAAHHSLVPLRRGELARRA